MAITRSFELAELIRHFKYDSTNDVIVTSKATQDKQKQLETNKSNAQRANGRLQKAVEGFQSV